MNIFVKMIPFENLGSLILNKKCLQIAIPDACGSQNWNKSVFLLTFQEKEALPLFL